MCESDKEEEYDDGYDAVIPEEEGKERKRSHRKGKEQQHRVCWTQGDEPGKGTRGLERSGRRRYLDVPHLFCCDIARGMRHIFQ